MDFEGRNARMSISKMDVEALHVIDLLDMVITIFKGINATLDY